ncbi:MAG: hypothetical protein PHW83_09440, partial [Bacteroidales bacterium]|nr:hypothetical protein [Bacteroidales bacterium]
MKYKIQLLIALIILVYSYALHGQITAPNSIANFQTTYSTAFISSGGTNDKVFIFCGSEDQTNIGELVLNAPGCDVSWYEYDGLSFVSMGLTGETASGLESGFYMARKNCGGTITCYRAWVWVNRTFVDVDAIPPGCQTFTLNGQAEVLDNNFDINDPPGSDFVVDADTYIKVCFWATHTYVSDIGFYLKSPGYQAANPGETGVVQLCPAASDWGPSAAQGSWTGIPWTSLGCSDSSDENTVCNSGNNVGSGTNGFCFQTHSAPGGGVMAAGTPSLTPCVCDLPTPLVGNYASVGPWTTIYGSNAAEPGWAVQIYDCEGADVGALTRATITIVGETDCGTATFTYDSGTINSTINDNSCNASSASIYVVPPGEPGGSYSVSSSITSTEWSSVPAGFSGTNLSEQIVAGTAEYPTETTDFILSVTETINVAGNPTCTTIASETFVTLPANATISPVNPMCVNSDPVQLQTASGGGTWTTSAPAGTIQNGYFYPATAGPGTHTITYTITGPCEDTDEVNVTVYDNIVIENFTDDVCSGDNTQYFVSFDVNESLGGSANFYVDLGTGSIPYNDNYAGTFTSNTIYNMTITDAHGCSEYEFHGLTNCGCETDAGTMTSFVPVILCADECSDMVTHQNNQQLDANDTFEFIIHDGSYPANILATNSTPEFCFNDIPSPQYNVTYYISAICGDDVGGHVSQIDPCYSQSLGTPVIWYENPVAYISETEFSTCGLSAILEAEPPSAGMTGSWSASSSFVPTGGSTISDPTINVLAADYGDVEFTWTIRNGNCNGSDNIMVHFNQTPIAYAGEDFSTCGTVADVEAVFSISGSTGYWSGPGSFTSSTSASTSVMSSIGVQIFTWREENGECWDEDNLAITFIQEPSPTAVSNSDTVCGNEYNLNVLNSVYDGYWTAYTGDPLQLMIPAPDYSPSIYSPQATVTIGNYPGYTKEVVFVWVETNQVNGVQCTNDASLTVVFSKTPYASVGPVNEAEICGSIFPLYADTTGSGWAEGTWFAKDVIASFDDVHDPFTSVTIQTPASFGDTAYVRVPFIWAMRNGGCSTMDTMWVTFYQRPVANAGLDDAICGNTYELGAVYDFTENEVYTPSGIWSAYNPPVGQTAYISPLNSDTTEVTVTQVGLWSFVFRENNSWLTFCYSTDTVLIEFVENPVISAGEDKDVCGQQTYMEAVSGGHDGNWLATPGVAFNDYTDPNTHIAVGDYGDITFYWLESNSATTTSLSCTSKDSVIITFWRVPTANILTDEADSTVCGLTFYNLRAENPGSEISGYWYNINPATDYGDEFSWSTWATVPNYGYHDFYWIEETGPGLTPGFCNDTAGPLTIRFIQIPDANAGGDTLFCGLTGFLHAIPSVGDGVWSTPSILNVQFADENNPNTQVTSNVINTGNPTYPDFTLIWTEDNSNGCTDSDTMKVIFARVPSSNIQIIPPKCFGEPATIAAAEDSLQQYTWNFSGGIIDSVAPDNDMGGTYENFVYWTDGEDS